MLEVLADSILSLPNFRQPFFRAAAYLVAKEKIRGISAQNFQLENSSQKKYIHKIIGELISTPFVNNGSGGNIPEHRSASVRKKLSPPPFTRKRVRQQPPSRHCKCRLSYWIPWLDKSPTSPRFSLVYGRGVFFIFFFMRNLLLIVIVLNRD